MNNFLEHVPVLLDKILENLKKYKITNGIIVDATFGLGGYSTAILENTNCDVYGFDRDPEVLKYANKLKEKYKNRFKFFQKKFSEIDDMLSEPNHSKKKIRAMIFDLGVSNLQLTKKNRGFSFKLDGPLDMRMSKEGTKAFEVINNSLQSRYPKHQSWPKNFIPKKIDWESFLNEKAFSSSTIFLFFISMPVKFL